jgi:hypothetical protein
MYIHLTKTNENIIAFNIFKLIFLMRKMTDLVLIYLLYVGVCDRTFSKLFVITNFIIISRCSLLSRDRNLYLI